MKMLCLSFMILKTDADADACVVSGGEKKWPGPPWADLPLSGINRSCLHWRLHSASTGTRMFGKNWTRDSDQRDRRETHDFRDLAALAILQNRNKLRPRALPLKGGKIYFSFVGPVVMTLVIMIIIRMYGRLISNSPILQNVLQHSAILLHQN